MTMPDVRAEPFFEEAFPEYCTRTVHGSTQHAALSVSGQVQPGYYESPLAPTLGNSIQHLLLGEKEHQRGIFEEACLRQHQATMTLTILSYPQSTVALDRFCLLTLSFLLDHLKYKPNVGCPIIVRGNGALFISHLQWMTTALGLDPAALSNRVNTYTARFFQHAAPIPKNHALEDHISKEILAAFRNYFASKVFSAEGRALPQQQHVSMRMA